MKRLVNGEMICEAEPLETDRPMLDRWTAELPRADGVRRLLIIREVEARIMRLALTQAGEESGEHVPSEVGAVRKVSEMARFVAENHAGSLRLDDVARQVGSTPITRCRFSGSTTG